MFVTRVFLLIKRMVLLHVLQRTVKFCEQLATVIPNAHVYYRRGLALKRVIPQCIARDFTYLMVINEDRQVPSILNDSGVVRARGFDNFASTKRIFPPVLSHCD